MNKLNKIIEYLIYLYIFLLPFSTAWILNEKFILDLKWQEGTILLYVTEILLWFIFCLYGWSLFGGHKSLIDIFKKIGLLKINKTKLLIVVFIWLVIVWSALSIIWSDNHFLSFYYWLKLIEAIILVLITLNININFNKLSISFMVAGVIQSGLAINQFLTQQVVANKYLGLSAHWPTDITASVIEIADQRWLRAYGSFSHPNILGGFLAICFLAAVYYYFNCQTNRKKIFSLLIVIIIFIGLFFSFSRSAWLATGLAFLNLIYFYGIKKYYKPIIKLLLSLGLVILILSLVYNSIILTRLSFSERLEIRSLTRRAESMVEAKEILKVNLMTGVGLGDYTGYLIKLKPNVPNWSYQPVHNIYILILSELGLFGLFIFLVLIWQSLIAAAYKLNKNPVYFSWLIIILIIGLFDHYFWTSYQGIILMMFILLNSFAKSEVDINNWDKVAMEYSQLIGDKGDFIRQLLINPYIQKQLKNINSGKVLDLGCGDGYLSRVFSSDNFQFTSIDSSVLLLEEAKIKKTPGQLIQADICAQIPLSENDFEAVVVNMVLMDVLDIKAVYANAYKLLKPGGILIVTILHPVLGSPVGYLFKTWPDKFMRRDPFIRIDKYGREFFSDKLISGLTQPTRIYHRPMSQYIQTAIDIGFDLKNISEPLMELEDLVNYNQPKFLSKYPIVLSLVFTKPEPGW